MKKKIIAFAGMAILTVSMATSALAAPMFAAAPVAGYGYCGGGYSMMWDQNGNFFDKDAFEANLDKMIEDGYILSGDRDYFLNRYDWCAAYGGWGYGMGRGRGCGMGRGW